MYSEGHKHVTDVKLDSIVVLLNRSNTVIMGDYSSQKNDVIILSCDLHVVTRVGGG